MYFFCGSGSKQILDRDRKFLLQIVKKIVKWDYDKSDAFNGEEN